MQHIPGRHQAPNDTSTDEVDLLSKPDSDRSRGDHTATDLDELIEHRRQLGSRLRLLHAALASAQAGDHALEERLHLEWRRRHDTDQELGRLLGRWLDQDGQVQLHTTAEHLPSHPTGPQAVVHTLRITDGAPTPSLAAAPPDMPITTAPPVSKAELITPTPPIPKDKPPAQNASTAKIAPIVQAKPVHDAPPTVQTPTARKTKLAATAFNAPPPAPAQPTAPPASTIALQRLVSEGIGSNAPASPTTTPLSTQHLSRLTSALPHPEAEPVSTAIRDLEGVIAQRDDWLEWPTTIQRAALLAVITTARALQDRAGYDYTINSMFGKLSAWSAQHRPGSVNGLARAHRPLHGTWTLDAELAQEQLRRFDDAPAKPTLNPEVQLGSIEAAISTPDDRALKDLLVRSLRVLEHNDPRLTKLLTGHLPRLLDEPKLKKLRKAVRALERKTPPKPSQPDGYPPADWPHFARTRDQRAVIVGGSPRTKAQDRIQKAFRFGSMEWIDPSDPRKVESLAERVRQKTVGMVILLHSFCPHRANDQLLPALKTSGTPWISVEQGYGVSQIRRAMERFWEQPHTE